MNCEVKNTSVSHAVNEIGASPLRPIVTSRVHKTRHFDILCTGHFVGSMQRTRTSSKIFGSISAENCSLFFFFFLHRKNARRTTGACNLFSTHASFPSKSAAEYMNQPIRTRVACKQCAFEGGRHWRRLHAKLRYLVVFFLYFRFR